MLKIICEITQVIGKYLQDSLGPSICEEASKLFAILLAWLWRVQKSLYHFCSQKDKGCAFVYNVVYVNKIFAVYLAKLPSYIDTQSTFLLLL